MRFFGPDIVTSLSQPKTRFQEFDENIWVKWIPYRFIGLPVGTRMTVVRLPDGQLWVHSPLRLDDRLVTELQALGNVKYLIAPNRTHDLYLEDFTAVAGAEAFASPVLLKTQAQLPWKGPLVGSETPAWCATIDQLLIEGYDWLSEVVFFHRPSLTLIIADLLECYDEHTTSSKAFLWLAARAGCYHRYSLTRDQRFLVRDRAAFRASIVRVLKWPFDRIILSHGPLVQKNGHAIFKEAFDWVLC